MNTYFATSIKRKKHSNEVLSATITELETLETVDMSELEIYTAIMHGNLKIVNLGLQYCEYKEAEAKVILTNYDKNSRLRGAKIAYYTVSNPNTSYITEYFIIMLDGYKGVYEFLIGNPENSLEPILLTGIIEDLKFTLKQHKIECKTPYIYNGYYDEKSNIILYKDKPYSNSNFIQQYELRKSLKYTICELLRIPQSNNYILANAKFNSSEITIPQNIVSMQRSLGSTSGLYSIYFDRSIDSLGTAIFRQDKTLNSVTLASQINELPNYFAADSSIREFNYLSNEPIHSIGICAFKGCTKLKNLILNAKEVKKGAFINSHVQSIKLINCTLIERIAFSNCKKLKSIIASDCTSIEEKAFECCKSLQKVYLPNILLIEAEAFKGCDNLKEVTLNRTARIASDAFDKEVRTKIKFNLV